MLHLSERRLVLGHPADAVGEAACAGLEIAAADLLDLTVAWRARARGRSSIIAEQRPERIEVPDAAG